MAKARFIITKFWSDSFIVELEPIERYLFIYFLTNEHTSISGIYELPKKVMARETGLEEVDIENILKKFEGKIYYIDNWVVIKNFIRNQNIQSVKSNVFLGVMRELENIPEKICLKLAKIPNLIEEILYPLKGLEGASRVLNKLPLLIPILIPKPKPIGGGNPPPKEEITLDSKTDKESKETNKEKEIINPFDL